MANHITGSCLCGAVKYEINGDPVFAGLCHCKDCQKYTGTGCEKRVIKKCFI